MFLGRFMSEFDLFGYYERCIEYGWGFNVTSRDVWAENPVLSPAQIDSLRKKEADRHQGWQPPRWRDPSTGIVYMRQGSDVVDVNAV